MIKVSERAYAIYKQLEAESRIEVAELSPQEKFKLRLDAHLPSMFDSEKFWEHYRSSNADRNDWLSCQEGNGNILLYRFSADINRRSENPQLNNLFDYFYIDISPSNTVHACLFSKVDMSNVISQRQAVIERNINKLYEKLDKLAESPNELEKAHIFSSLSALTKTEHDLLSMVATPKFSDLCKGNVIAFNQFYPDTTIATKLSDLTTKDFEVDKTQLQIISNSIGLPREQLIMYLDAAVAYKQANSLYEDGKINGYQRKLIESNINITFADALNTMNCSLIPNENGSYTVLDKETGEIHENCQTATDIVDKVCSPQTMHKCFTEPLSAEFKIALPKAQCPNEVSQWLEWLYERSNNTCSIEENRFINSHKDMLNQMAVLLTENRNVNLNKAAFALSVLETSKDNYETARQKPMLKSNTERD